VPIAHVDNEPNPTLAAWHGARHGTVPTLAFAKADGLGSAFDGFDCLDQGVNLGVGFCGDLF